MGKGDRLGGAGGHFNFQKHSWDAAAQNKLKLWEMLVRLELFWLLVVRI